MTGDELLRQGGVRVVVVRGEGRAFSAGLDRSVFTDPGPGGLRALATLADADADLTIAGFQAPGCATRPG